MVKQTHCDSLYKVELAIYIEYMPQTFKVFKENIDKRSLGIKRDVNLNILIVNKIKTEIL